MSFSAMPVAAVGRLRESAGANTGAPLVARVGGGACRESQVVAALRYLVAQAAPALNLETISGHSMRVTGAQCMARVGLSEGQEQSLAGGARRRFAVMFGRPALKVRPRRYVQWNFKNGIVHRVHTHTDTVCGRIGRAVHLQFLSMCSGTSRVKLSTESVRIRIPYAVELGQTIKD